MGKTKNNVEPILGATIAAKIHTIQATVTQRMSALNLIMQCDIKPKLQIGAVTTLTVLRGDWPRNKIIETGYDQAGNQKYDDDEKKKPTHDERDDSCPFGLNEDQRIFLAEFLKSFFEGELERTIPNPMGGSRQEKLKPSGRDLSELMPLYERVKHTS